jgi:hypothetical protein
MKVNVLSCICIVFLMRLAEKVHTFDLRVFMPVGLTMKQQDHKDVNQPVEDALGSHPARCH